MKNNFFDKDYVEYWKGRVKEKRGVSKVPGRDVEQFFIKKLKILKSDIILDLGCGHGRLFSLLKKFTLNIFGMDVTLDSIKEASQYPYKQVLKGGAEKTSFKKGYFDKVVSWATYDVVEQEKALREENRILKMGGKLLITGKNDNYELVDKEAFIAERNAKLKKFPNRFTNVYGLIKNIETFGFEVEVAYGFKKRGDFGNLKYFSILKGDKRLFYEFLLILKKVAEPKLKKIKICDEYSKTAIYLTKQSKFKNTKTFFRWHKSQNEK